jgi:uncharacterized RmlC-like cupin family protein
MKRTITILIALVGLTLAGFIAVHTGVAHRVFFEIFAFVKGDGLIAPNVFRIPPVHSPYERWLQRARKELPLYAGQRLHDVVHVDLKPWPQQGDGVYGLYLRFANYQMVDGRLIEIPSGGNTRSERHLYEEGIYVLSGSGYTMLQQQDQAAQRIDWRQGDLFAVPLNVRHQHFATGDQSARLLMVTSFPMVLNLIDNEHFIHHADYPFTDRYDGASNFLQRRELLSEHESSVNFIENVPTTATVPNTGSTQAKHFMHWRMAGNSMLKMHVSEIPARTHLNAHRHSSDALILILEGEGFSLTWPESRWDDRIRVDWKAGSLFVPPIFWYHQHFNSGSTPSRHLAINVPDLVRNLGLNFNNELEVDSEQVKAEWKKALERLDEPD